MQTIPIHKHIQLYRESYARIVKSAITGTDLSEEMHTERRKKIQNWNSNANLDHCHALVETILSQKDFMPDPNAYQLVRSKRAPIPLQPEYFKKTIPKKASVAIMDLFGTSPLHGLIAEVFKNSVFAPGDSRYRSDYKDGVMIICGADDNVFIALASLLHELGHCLVERLSGADFSRRQVISEAYAQILEEIVVCQYLASEQDRLAWCSYQREIDHLNYYFCLLELSQTRSFSYLTRHINADFFDSSLLLLRQTFFTDIGYQSVYAEASLIRQKVLNKFFHHEKL
ncbi:MAG: hypothetical protein Q7T03_10765 [Deltaproteobacteria bacterium]|nr:hypothetical protein [Deltaproteobacteria bacterium]